jgi:ribosomal protein S18 acetylase RimI-like enzyme
MPVRDRRVTQAEAEEMITIRPGTPADAVALAEFAAQSFRNAFERDNRPEDLALHLARSYGPRQQGIELADPEITTLLAQDADRLAGYAQLRPGAPPPCVAAGGSLELWRFYVGEPWHGRGVAQALMARVVAAARARSARTLWLGVWERNPRAQAFYRKVGFERVGGQTFMVGNDAQTDHVMALTLVPVKPVGVHETSE